MEYLKFSYKTKLDPLDFNNGLKTFFGKTFTNNLIAGTMSNTK